jgi:hypothetical protein
VGLLVGVGMREWPYLKIAQMVSYTIYLQILQCLRKIGKTCNQFNLKLCQRGEWQDRMLVETVLSMLTLVCHFKKVMHRGWAYFQARLAFTMAAFNVLVQWHGFQPYASGFVPLSMADFSL